MSGATRRGLGGRTVARGALYAALYAVLTVAPGLNALAYGQVQFRLSEALMVFACVDPAAVVGLTVGCAVANLGSPLMPLDPLVGSACTLLAALAMRRLGPRPLALAAPVVTNAFGVAAMLALLLDLPYWASVAWVALGEAAVMATAGAALLVLVRRRGALLGITLAAG